MWSKDIVLLFSDGDLHGTQAWLRAYYGSTGQFSALCLQAHRLMRRICVDNRPECRASSYRRRIHLGINHRRLPLSLLFTHWLIPW